MDRYIEDEKKKADDIICLVWYTEVLHRQKRLQKLEKLLNKKPKNNKMTAHEMLEKVKKLNSALGGEIK